MKFPILLASALLASAAFAGPEHHHPTPRISPEFQNMKALVGTWEGTTKMSGMEEAIKVTYELTSGGTALVEKMGPGTPNEMTTIYANRGNSVNATHFCLIGNQPEMKLKNAKANRFEFEMNGTKGISDKNEMHMHAVTLTLEGNKLKHEWTNYNAGKKGEVAVFEFTKK